ncbi:MAG: 16S rRNA processing protein RimM [Nitrospirae bacterium]|nr:16S rRNA processing protein RimM [Nitrospirota bacterium]
MLIGRIIKPWGVKGELKAQLIGISEETLMSVDDVTLSGSGHSFHITSKKFRPDCVVLKFDGIDSPEEAIRFNGMSMEAEGVELPPLEEGQYYIDDIIGLDVVSADGQTLGKVSDVQSYPANDCYVLQYNGRECLIPAIAEVVKEINIEGGYMKIEIMEGLLG